jgi:hypothetical protein
VSGGLGGEALGDDAAEVVEADGFGEEVVHAGFAAGLANASESVAGHGDDGGLALEEEVATDLAGGVDAAHDGHLEVHEDDFVVGMGDHFDGFLPVIGDVNGGIAQTLEEHGGDFLVQWLILDEEDTGGVLIGKSVASGAGRPSEGSGGGLGDLNVVIGGGCSGA